MSKGMFSSKLFKQAFVLLMLIWILFLLALFLYLEIYFWWYDVILHFLSGICVSMATLSAWDYLFKPHGNEKNKLIFIGFLGALIIGVLWEIYEVKAGITFPSDGIFYIRDTVSDLILDMTGGLFGVLYSV